MQVATEGNVVNVINSHYNLLFHSMPPGTTNEPGMSLDDFRCLAQYQTAAGVQLSVPQHGVDAGYFSATTFDASPGGTEVPNTIDSERDNVRPNYENLTTLYSNTYMQTMADIYAPDAVPALPINTNRFAAHTAAAVVVLDYCDALFTAGQLKAQFGDLPATTPNPAAGHHQCAHQRKCGQHHHAAGRLQQRVYQQCPDQDQKHRVSRDHITAGDHSQIGGNHPMHLKINTKSTPSHISRRQFLIRGGCGMMSLTSLVNILAQLKLMQGVVNAQGVPSNDYKALVCVFLAGGNDSNNLLIPFSGTANTHYASNRGVLAIPVSGANP
jgi:hypothetical protein